MPDCELKPQCTANTYRRVGRWTEEAVLDRMEARLAARPEILKQRREAGGKRWAIGQRHVLAQKPEPALRALP